ncbi:MAG: class II aldolase/adducin family protein [Proteobacteria bacterium]|nr:class II aldolase/adducin family protein [Pseudomonadota bacterium]MBU1595140.1 class II aldolase/adducin family protein [Pseudomonadota bacterium]
MIPLLAKYAAKLAATGLVAPDDALLAALDDELAWSRAGDVRQPLMQEIFAGLNISALLLARPAGVYQAVMAELARQALADGAGIITPGDCETRTFLHDLPVVQGLQAEGVIQALRRRKGCVILHGDEAFVAAFGTVSPEQAYVTMSSMCFACFVAYFAQHLRDLRSGRMTPERRAEFARIKALLPPDRSDVPDLAPGPFASEDAARAAMIQAGRRTVEYGLVDSYFGNISYRLPVNGVQTILISQTGSSLDELGPCIDPCRMDGGNCAAITASSEYSAHKAVYEGEGVRSRAILHGHPRFSVIVSLDCPRLDCPNLGECHRACDTPRCFTDAASGLSVPIVPGEVGTGPFGLCNTLPQALTATSGEKRGAIVYGHGLFTLGEADFRDAFATLMDVERFCREEYFRRVKRLGGGRTPAGEDSRAR